MAYLEPPNFKPVVGYLVQLTILGILNLLFYFHKTLKCKIMESLVDSERFCKSLTKYKRKEVSTNNVTNTPYFSHALKYFP